MEVKDIISSGLLELYITGLTSNEETLQVEQWAEQYPEVKIEIADLQNAIESYVMAQAIHPDDLLKEKILRDIGCILPAAEGGKKIHDGSPVSLAKLVERDVAGGGIGFAGAHDAAPARDGKNSRRVFGWRDRGVRWIHARRVISWRGKEKNFRRGVIAADERDTGR